MSNSESSPRSGSKQKKTLRHKAARALSASEISKNSHHFEIWCTYQYLERAAYEDIPESFKQDVETVFDVSGRLPIAWTEQESEEYKLLSSFAPPEFLEFIAEAYNEDPSLFGAEINELPATLYLPLTTVFTAWQRLKAMLHSSQRWSEADFADAYAQFRGPALKESTRLMQCSVSLPQPLQTHVDSEAARILNTRKSIPDCVVMVPPESIRHLSNSTDSAFKRLKKNKAIKKTGSAVKSSSFAYQATICYSIPDTPAFEFVSSIWEDKKPVHSMPEHAYRQNRMSTASAARQLHSMHVDAPVFGLTWTHGHVRAHVDWCQKPQPDEHPVVYSAPYIRSVESKDSAKGNQEYHRWDLTRASDILDLYFLINNIDRWTTRGFLGRVNNGVSALEKSIVEDGKTFEPWRRSGDIVPRVRRSLNAMENAELSASVLTQCSNSPKPKRKYQSRAIR
ncbi:hypothetical protein GGU11DRAFT_5491 [Lentinula aff. detonsa]|uniref:Uncharacterized protein n=1 Tax=Lentinula aff. detonsa TaxID=2804958 RepID=A0AA38NP72_9AGAR|nr:hypothetical protein GGU10DRAFT_53583 [Lentinula aff. detonsa]KAJ3803412.1 hypothetical protein GGU11DRAFT_5491 [Lentinula aff. detonsa]